MEKVDNPVNGMDNMDDPREVVDDVKKCVFVLDRLDGLIGIEDEEEEQHEEVEEAEDCAPVAPKHLICVGFQTIWNSKKSLRRFLVR